MLSGGCVYIPATVCGKPFISAPQPASEVVTGFRKPDSGCLIVVLVCIVLTWLMGLEDLVGVDGSKR